MLPKVQNPDSKVLVGASLLVANDGPQMESLWKHLSQRK